MPDKPMILIVDDEPAIRSLAAKVLTGAGYEVREFASGREAVDFFREHKEQVALALIDMVMPDLTGPKTLERMREWDANVRAVAISGFLGSIDRQQIERDFLEFLPKPFAIQSLLDVVARHAPGT